MEEANTILRMCGITKKYKGYTYIDEIINVMLEQYNLNSFVEFNRSMYQVVSSKYNISIESVERNIKTVIDRCIANNRILTETILGYQIYKSPTNADFLEGLVVYILDMYGK